MSSQNASAKSTHGGGRAPLFPSDGADPDTPSAGRAPGADRGGTVGPPPASPPAPPVPDDDPFNPERLRLSQDFAAAVGVRKLLVTVPVRKPDKAWWVRTHPEAAYRLSTGVLELKEDRETYLVDPSLWAELATEPTFSPQLLVTAVNRQGVVFLWPIRLPGPDGKVMEWHRSAQEAADVARDAWTRVYADMTLGAYRVETSGAVRTEPAWPGLPFREILKVAFRDKMISSWDHPVLQRLRGEV